MTETDSFSIVALDRFIQATRDSGYRGTPSAVAELVDNALQAGAELISVDVTPDDHGGLQVFICDDGEGMKPAVLREALRFGGTTRFGDRGGLGRFGMGLPNASLSQAKRLEVYTWQDGSDPWFSYLDVDEISRGKIVIVPEPVAVAPSAIPGGFPRSDSGTVVVWKQADRLDNRRASTIHRKLAVTLGRVFRYFIWDGVTISVGGEEVIPIDPLFVHEHSRTTGGALESEWKCEVRDDPGESASGVVTVRFSTLPVGTWSRWSNDEKRSRGVTNGAGVSIIRAAREVEYGWHLMGKMRRQNYDDWWRAEVQFTPALDAAFGVTHTKQSIRPAAHLSDAIVPYMESVGRELHKRVRSEYAFAKGEDPGALRSRSLASAEELKAAQAILDSEAHFLPDEPHSTLDKDALLSAVMRAAARAEAGSSASDKNALRRFRKRWVSEISDLLE